MAIIHKLSIDNIPIFGKRVLVRVDFNVPIDKITGKITSTQRIEAALPTIKYILDQKAAAIILISHLGRPDGKKDSKYSLRPVAEALNNLLGRQITFLDDCIGPAVEETCKHASNGQVILLENVRFHIEEEGSVKDDAGNKIKADPQSVALFRKSLSNLGDIYVNDAFGTCHRAHSSMVGIDLPVRACGFLIKKELEYFHSALYTPKRPFAAIIGGAKVSDKLQLIENLLQKVDIMIIGGGMAYTFKKVINSMQIGSSLFDEAGSHIIMKIMKLAAQNNVKIALPTDHLVADKISVDASIRVVDDEAGIPEKWIGLDIGPKSIENFIPILATAKTILWNGPLGMFELKPFERGTREVLEAVVNATSNGSISIVGGGDTATAVEKWNMGSGISHVSTGGGAALELLEGKELPGIAYLSNSEQ